MSNNFFQFKQMRINQANAAMKVSTDACIQGAWTPIDENVENILDIGTGTGLLSLMVAQRKQNVQIDALELDSNAIIDATQNFEQSTFKEQIKIHNCDAKLWQAKHHYELIICNPPFFTQSLKSPNSLRNLARHNDSLTYDELAQIISKNLHPSGKASILIPLSEEKNWYLAATNNHLNTQRILYIKPFSENHPNRMVLIVGKEKFEKITKEDLIIYQEPKQYTQQFIQLMQPFYLHL